MKFNDLERQQLKWDVIDIPIPSSQWLLFHKFVGNYNFMVYFFNIKIMKTFLMQLYKAKTATTLNFFQNIVNECDLNSTVDLKHFVFIN